MGDKKDIEEVRERTREAKRRRGGLLSVLVLLSVLLVSLLGCTGGTATPTSVRGEVKGKLLEEENLLPLKGALVVLAQYRSENEWVLNADFATTTDNDGSFILSDVEAGEYLVLYERTGEALTAKESWNGKEVSFLDDMMLVCQDSETQAEFAYAAIRNNIVYPGHGHVVILEWGLILEYKESAASGEGTPMQIKVEPKQISEIEILAWQF